MLCETHRLAWAWVDGCAAWGHSPSWDLTESRENEGKRGISNITSNQRKQIGKGLAMGRGGLKMAQHCRWMWLAPWIPAPPLSHPCPFLVPDLGDGCAWVIRGHRCSDGAASLPQYSRRVQGCRFELLCLHRTAGRGRKEGTQGADVLRINPCHLLLRLAAKKKKPERICLPHPTPFPYPKCPPRGGGATSQLIPGAKASEKPRPDLFWAP